MCRCPAAITRGRIVGCVAAAAAAAAGDVTRSLGRDFENEQEQRTDFYEFRETHLQNKPVTLTTASVAAVALRASFFKIMWFCWTNICYTLNDQTQVYF